MTVETTSTYAGPYPLNGVATAFPFTFKALTAAEVAVEIDGIPVDASVYSVQLTSQGGTAVFPAPPAGTALYVVSKPDFRQGISFSNQSAFLPDSHNEANDRAAVRDQVLAEGLNRAIQLPLGEEAPTLPPAAQRAGGNKILAPDPLTGAITVLDGSAFAGDTGPADNTYADKPSLAASDITRGVASLKQTPTQVGARYYWTPGNFTGRTDVIVSTFGAGVPISQGAWVPQPASGIAYGSRDVGSTLDETFYVENYRYAGTDTQTLTEAFRVFRMAKTGTLVFGKGRKYDLGKKSDVASVFEIQSGLSNAVFDLNGSTVQIETDHSTSLPIYNVFDIGNYSRVTFRNGTLTDIGYTTGIVSGACWITPQPGSQTCQGLTLDNIDVIGGVAPIQPKGPSNNGRIRGIHIVPNCTFRNVYYGLNCVEQGDDITGGFTAIDTVRAYFPYGCTGHSLEIFYRIDNPMIITETVCLIKRVSRDTSNISLRLAVDGPIVARNAVVKLEHQNNDGAASVIDNVNVMINLAPTATDPNGVARLGFRSFQTNGSENTGMSAHVTSNVRLSGDLMGTTTGVLTFTAATTNGSAVLTPSGLFAGQVVDYFPTGALVMGPGIPVGANVVSADASTVTLNVPATATAAAASFTRSPVHVRSHYTPAKEVRISLDPGIRGAAPTQVSAYQGFCFRVARDREYRLFRGDLTTAGLPINLSGLDNVSTLINVGTTFLGDQSGATAQDRTYYEFNVFLTIPPGGPISVQTTQTVVNNSSGAAAAFGGFVVSGKQLQATISGGAYARATSFARIDTTYRDQIP